MLFGVQAHSPRCHLRAGYDGLPRSALESGGQAIQLPGIRGWAKQLVAFLEGTTRALGLFCSPLFFVNLRQIRNNPGLESYIDSIIIEVTSVDNVISVFGSRGLALTSVPEDTWVRSRSDVDCVPV